MADIEKNLNEEEMEEVEVITLTDDESGESQDFEILDHDTIDGKVYYALDPHDGSGEYVILSAVENGDEVIFSTIDDDDEFEKVEEFFNDRLFDEVDYDA